MGSRRATIEDGLANTGLVNTSLVNTSLVPRLFHHMENAVAHGESVVRDSLAHSESVVRDSLWLHRYTLLLAVCTLFLVVAGAEVTSHQAGLSVPDWPLSYGRVMPPMTGGVFFEHGHRMVATSVGMLTIGLVMFLARREKRAWMRRLGWVALGAVIV